MLVACSSIPKTSKDDWRRDCRNGVCLLVTYDRATNVEVFEVSSDLPDPVTFTLRIEFSHASAIPIMNKVQITKVIKPRERIEILSLNAEEENENVLFNYQYWWKQGPLKGIHQDDYSYRIPFKTGNKIKIMQANHGAYTQSPIPMKVASMTNIKIALTSFAFCIRTELVQVTCTWQKMESGLRKGMR